MKKIVALLLTFAMLFSVSACAYVPVQAPAQAPAQQAEPEAKKPVIGITTFSTTTVFSRNAREVVKAKITEKGGEYIDNVATDTLSRTEAIENFISQGVDAIILLSGDVSECEEALNEAKAKGILIGSCDGGYIDCVDIYTSSDNYAIGEQVVTELVNKMGNTGNIVQIYNDLGSMDRKRKGGAADIVAQNPETSIKYGFVYAWPDYFDDVKTKMEALILSNGDDINGVFATFDGVGLAALQAVREAGLEAQMPIVGVDGDPEALNEILNPDSAYIATVIQSWTDCGNICVNELFNKLNGGEISSAQVQVPGILVTKENAAQMKEEYPDLFVME